MLESKVSRVPSQQTKTFLRLRKRMVGYHKMRPTSLQPASSYPSPFAPDLAETLELANMIKRTFDSTGSRAREILYMLLRYPLMTIAFDDSEIRAFRTAAELQPPKRWEKQLNEHCCRRGGNRNPFVDHPGLVTDFSPHQL